MWNLPRPEIESVSPALADRFSSIVPAGKSLHVFSFNLCPHGHATVMGNTVNLSGINTPTRLKAKKAIFHISAPQSNRLKLVVAHTLQDYSLFYLQEQDNFFFLYLSVPVLSCGMWDL